MKNKTDESPQSEDEETMKFIIDKIWARLKQMDEEGDYEFGEWLACWQVLTQVRQTSALIEIAATLRYWHQKGSPVEMTDILKYWHQKGVPIR